MIDQYGITRNAKKICGEWKHHQKCSNFEFCPWMHFDDEWQLEEYIIENRDKIISH